MEYLLTVEPGAFNKLLQAWGVLGIFSALGLYLSRLMPMSGREDNAGLSILGRIDKKRGWIIMETPVLLAVLYFYFAAGGTLSVAGVFVAVFVLHYVNRALIFPHRIRVSGKTMPVSIMLSSMMFYAINGYLIGYYFGALADYTIEWLWDPRFILGLLLFAGGMVINIHSDNILIRLRKPGEAGYKIPQGGMFRYLSCPNYFGEILEWIGFAIMSWSLVGVVYALWVVLPLVAQGIRAHQWYREKFGNQYPPERRAVLPCLI